MRQALRDLDKLVREHPDADELATYIYKPFLSDSRLSKVTAAQYLASILQSRIRRGGVKTENLRTKLPRYIVAAIEHVTLSPEDGTTAEDTLIVATVA
ncbi:MAG: hypothetical protein WAM66_07555 [Acidobacteriaceae bacterium]